MSTEEQPERDPAREEPASFRDRHARVFYADHQVFRALRQPALDAWLTLSATRFLERAIDRGDIVQTELIDPGSIALSLPSGSWAGVLRHETIPFISYPYEWCFGMLKDAALLQLDLLLAALGDGITSKDATPFNIQWKGSQPVFIDVASFERLEPGDPWVGYRQFCQTFLYPLLLQAYKNVPFQPWLRGSLEGIEPGQCRQLMSAADMFRPGVLRHVYLHAAMQHSNESTTHSVKAELHDAGLPTALIQKNVASLKKLIGHLAWKQSASAWSDYETSNSYAQTDHAAKVAFVDAAAASGTWNLVWDIGCNTGAYSRVLAKHARSVIAMDADHLVIERLYHALKGERDRTILPLVMNITDPSPGLGWRGLERRPLVNRGRPDLVVCLALIHHVVIAGHVPLTEFVAWLGSITDSLIIEFVTKDDPMVARLLQNKSDIYDDYDLELFERSLAEHFSISRHERLSSGTRFLFFATRPR